MLEVIVKGAIAGLFWGAIFYAIAKLIAAFGKKKRTMERLVRDRDKNENLNRINVFKKKVSDGEDLTKEEKFEKKVIHEIYPSFLK